MENAGHHGPGKHWDEQIHDIFWAEYGCERPSWIGTAGEGMAKERDDGVSTAGSGDFRLWNRPDSWNGCPALWALVVVSDSTAQSCLGRRRYRFSSHC